eukprot:CAMPEP_0176122380 /NCGR_PEP_ID=MMETSP0120_2-20121206/61635_1 /TAXON_ID=160619 /ORGANISM="Kryptoperidinium foliaceum, Strain CCMP 1326" /LENGTH=72 /DNA_ID=CAMNT_0017457003 /DNA_START=54 /DNA_END=269 /DNA_ORIENTATION=-
MSCSSLPQSASSSSASSPAGAESPRCTWRSAPALNNRDLSSAILASLERAVASGVAAAAGGAAAGDGATAAS